MNLIITHCINLKLITGKQFLVLLTYKIMKYILMLNTHSQIIEIIYNFNDFNANLKTNSL